MPYSVGSKSSTSAAVAVSLACLSDSEIRRRSRSMSMILTMTSSLTLDDLLGDLDVTLGEPRRCTRPSMPSSTRTEQAEGHQLE